MEAEGLEWGRGEEKIPPRLPVEIFEHKESSMYPGTGDIKM